ITTAVAKYEGGEINGTLGMLHNYLKQGLGMSDIESCRAAASAPDTSKASTDVFDIKRHQFYATLVSRCGPAGSAVAAAAYEKLRVFFDNKLAGRYPFIDSTQSIRAADADPANVREFIRQYNGFMTAGDAALRSHPAILQSAKGALDF